MTQAIGAGIRARGGVEAMLLSSCLKQDLEAGIGYKPSYHRKQAQHLLDEQGPAVDKLYGNKGEDLRSMLHSRLND
ncbi:hypothetical protein GCM10027346_35250 [Hymenobacter seoulensis]